MANFDSQDNRLVNQTYLSGPEVDVPCWSVDSYRKAGSSGLPTHVTHPVASQKQLEGSRVTGKGYPNTQVPPPSSRVVAGGEQCAPRSTITPTKHALQLFTDAPKEGWGIHLNEHTARGDWLPPVSKLHINVLELKAVFLALKEFQDLCQNNVILVATDTPQWWPM